MRRALVGGAMLVALSAGAAHAQVCGDADANGVVSLSDGVQVLRAAAGLAACPTPRCDVDGSGTVTVTDGVNVLRAAADIGVDFRCAVLSAQEQQVFGALQKSTHVTGLIERGLDVVTAPAAAAGAADGGPCPGGGTVQPDANGVVYDACRVGYLVCSGTGTMDGGEFVPLLDCFDVERQQDFQLAAAVAPSESTQGRAISGTASGMQDLATVFQFDYDQLTLDDDLQGGRSGGGIEVGGAFFAGAFERVEMSFPGRNPETGEPDQGFVKIVGLRSGGGGIIFVFVFDLNLTTGKLTAR